MARDVTLNSTASRGRKSFRPRKIPLGGRQKKNVAGLSGREQNDCVLLKLKSKKGTRHVLDRKRQGKRSKRALNQGNGPALRKGKERCKSGGFNPPTEGPGYEKVRRRGSRERGGRTFEKKLRKAGERSTLSDA